MGNSRKPISFLATSAPDATKLFYTEVLGLESVADTPFSLVFLDRDHMLRIQKIPDHSPAAYTVHGWQSEDIELDIEELASRGVEFLPFDGLEQAPSGVWVTPDGGKVAWFKDPGGNVLSLTQFA